jgi:signal transduction histidine kinase
VLATVHEITEKVRNERRITLLRELGAHSADAKTAKGACASAAETLRDAKDVPFALFYLIEADRKSARLAAASGIGMGMDASPITLSLVSDTGPWNVGKALETDQLQTVENLRERFSDIPCGPWLEPPHSAAILPIRSNVQRQPAGLLIAGISPRQRFDQSYGSFFELLSTQVATAIANARAYEEERKRAEALAELDRAKTVFFSNVSHEFRTPLTLLLGPLEESLASAPSNLPVEVRANLEVAHRNSLRLLKLVNSLLEFSRIEAGRIEANYEPIDLALYTSELVSLFRSAIEKAGLRLVVDCPPLPEPVYVDCEMWEKVVLNLLSNAFKFTFDGQIKVELRWLGEFVELSVSDSGVGIPEQELPKVFERFYRVRGVNGRTHEGTGIGLALVLELVRLHGGTVSALSQERRGTTFTVTIRTGRDHLPASSIHNPSRRSIQAARTQFVQEALRWLPAVEQADHKLEVPSANGMEDSIPLGGSPSLPPPRILLADDNADMREYVCRLLSPHCQVDAVGDGEAAMARIRTRHPDLLLTDVMMPRMDGVELLRTLRAEPETRDIPVIMLSARAGEEARVEGLQAGANDYLIKPFTARELLARVQSQLELARVRRESNAAVRESEERFRAFVTASSDAVYRMSPNWSEMRSLRGRGFIPDTSNPNPSWLQTYIHPDDRTQVLGAIEKAVQSKSVFELEHRVIRTDGTLGWTFSRAIPLLNNQGELIEWFGAAADITERRNAEQALREAQNKLREHADNLECAIADRTAQLRETVTELEAFSYSVAHDLRAPLRALQGFGQFLADEYAYQLDERAKSYLHRMSRAAERMDQLITDVLDYSHVVRSAHPLEPVDIQKLLAEIIQIYPSLTEQSARISIQGEFPIIMGNPARLTQCFSNLLSNATKFVAPGVTPEVRIWSETRDDWTRICVCDNGIGIPSDQHEKIFEIFQRVSKDYEGTGIGLAIVKKAGERMQGRVGVDSAPGRGSTFWIELRPAPVIA